MYQYKAKVISVYDGDSCTVEVDLGFNIKLKQTLRIYGIDCPEIRTKNKREKMKGLEVRDFVRRTILNKEVTLNTHKPDKYGGRYLADVILEDGIMLSKLLIDMGYARAYFGEKKKPYEEKND